jgi:hypothetical protein
VTSPDKAISDLYAEFESYGPRDRMESCPCCRGPARTRPLHEKPLRELTPRDLHGFAFSAITAIGDADDFRYFLPRILELLLSPEFRELVEPEVVLSKLSYGNWHVWPKSERQAVRYFLHSLWNHVRTEAPGPHFYNAIGVDSWLSAIARAETDLRPYLEDWHQDQSPEAAANLARFVADYRKELASDRVPDAYSNNAGDQWSQIREWLNSIGALSA